MNDPTQEQRGVSEPLCKCGHTYFMHEGCEIEACCESDGKDFCECEKYEPVEQGVSMDPELRKRIEFSRLDNSHPATHCLRLLVDFNISVGKACEYLSKYFLTGQRDPIANEVGPYDPMLDEVAASEIARQLRASREEVSKLSTRIDEIQLAETKAVEELARVRALNQELLKRMGVALELIQSKHAKRHFNMYAEGIVKVLDTKSNDHPESKCQLCGGPNYRWHVDSPDWNAAMRSGDEPDVGSIVCPNCFMRQSQKMGIDQQWHIEAER